MIFLKAIVISLPGIIGIFYLINSWRLPTVYLRLGIFLLFASVSQVGAILLNIYYGSNFEFYNVVIAVNYLFYYFVFLAMSRESFYQFRIHLVFTIGAGFLAYLLIRYFQVSFAVRALSVVNIVVIVYSLLFFYHMLRTPLLQSIYQQGKFWITTGFFVHHLSVFSLWLTYEYTSYLANDDLLVVITFSLTLLQYVIFMIAVFVQLKFETDDRAEQ